MNGGSWNIVDECESSHASSFDFKTNFLLNKASISSWKSKKSCAWRFWYFLRFLDAIDSN